MRALPVLLTLAIAACDAPTADYTLDATLVVPAELQRSLGEGGVLVLDARGPEPVAVLCAPSDADAVVPVTLTFEAGSMREQPVRASLVRLTPGEPCDPEGDLHRQMAWGDDYEELARAEARPWQDPFGATTDEVYTEVELVLEAIAD